MTWLLENRPLKSVLVSRQRYLGDIVMATVVLEVLHRGDAELRLGFLCESGHGAVLAHHEQLHDLHLLDRRRSGPDARARGVAAKAPEMTGDDHRPKISIANGTWNLIQQLRSARYDLVVDLFFNPYSAWLFKLSGIPGRIGGTPKWRRRLYTHTVQFTDPAVRESGLSRCAPGGLGEHLCRLAPLVHEESGLGFLDWMNQEYGQTPVLPRLTPFPERDATTIALREIGIEAETPFLLLAPGATWPSKEWPVEHWQELIRRLVTDSEFKLAILLPPNRSGRWKILGSEISAGRGGVLPVLGLSEVLDAIGRCTAMVSVDGGMMHTGIGLGRPTVGLFGPTDPEIWFPYLSDPRFAVLADRPHCHPCDLHECDEFICLPNLTPERVAESILKRAAAERPAGSQEGGAG